MGLKKLIIIFYYSFLTHRKFIFMKMSKEEMKKLLQNYGLANNLYRQPFLFQKSLLQNT